MYVRTWAHKIEHWAELDKYNNSFYDKEMLFELDSWEGKSTPLFTQLHLSESTLLEQISLIPQQDKLFRKQTQA